MCQVPIPFLLFFKYPFNYVTGQSFQTIVAKNIVPGSISKRNPIKSLNGE